MKTKSFIAALTFVLQFFITACQKDIPTNANYNYIKYECSFLHSPTGIVLTTYVNDSANNENVKNHSPIGNFEFYTGIVKKGFEAKMKTIITENISGVKEFYITQNIYGSNDNNNFKLIKSNFKTLSLNDSAQLSYTLE